MLVGYTDIWNHLWSDIGLSFFHYENCMTANYDLVAIRPWLIVYGVVVMILMWAIYQISEEWTPAIFGALFNGALMTVLIYLLAAMVRWL